MRAATLVALAALVACGKGAQVAPSTGPQSNNGQPQPAAPNTPCDLDLALDGASCAALHAAQLPAQLPPAPGNAHGDDTNAALLGFSVFFDARFSSNQNVRCATCHMPENKFGDGKTVSVGMQPVTRNAPTVLNAARQQLVFWDGRADSVWSQPLFAFENPKEMDFTRLEIAHQVFNLYKPDYEGLFGPLPPLGETTRFPPAGKPGDASFDGMSAADQEAVNRVVANVGKSLEAYERKLATSLSPFDRFLAGDASALTADQKAGMLTFAKDGCLQCHGGPNLTDEKFHNLGVPAWPDAGIDVGRADAFAALENSPFTASGPYWEGAPPAVAEPPPSAADEGAFRTPTLRNVALSAPYLHNGRAATLRDAILAHVPTTTSDPASFAGQTDPLLPQQLSSSDVDQLVTFLGALNGDYPQLPWADWPQH